MSDKELLRILLVNSKSIRDERTYRAHTYGVLMTLLLSKEIFKNNTDIEPFLKENEINFKPYVFDSRTQIAGKVCRLIESFDLSNLKKINSAIHQIAFNENDKELKSPRIIKKIKEENYFDSLLSQFERKKYE